MRKQTLTVFVSLCAVLVSVYVQAHHSRAVFDATKTIEIRGIVVDFKLRSPHSSLVVDGVAFIDGVRQSDGVERWEIEAESVTGMRIMGMEADTFETGDRVTIVGAPHRDPSFKFAGVVDTYVAADGSRYLRGAGDRAFDPTVRAAYEARGLEPPTKTAAAPPEAAGVRRIEGRWQQPIQPAGDESVLPLNEAGLAAWRIYDAKTSPASTCEPASIPSVFHAPVYLLDVHFDDDEVVLYNEAFGIRRTVPLSGEPVITQPDGQFGTVSGRVEGDTLVVESWDYPPSEWGLGRATVLDGGGADVPSSEQKEVTERFSAEGAIFRGVARVPASTRFRRSPNPLCTKLLPIG